MQYDEFVLFKDSQFVLDISHCGNGISNKLILQNWRSEAQFGWPSTHEKWEKMRKFTLVFGLCFFWFWIFIPQDINKIFVKKGLKASELNKIEEFSKCGCCCCCCGDLKEVDFTFLHIFPILHILGHSFSLKTNQLWKKIKNLNKKKKSEKKNLKKNNLKTKFERRDPVTPGSASVFIYNYFYSELK